MKSTKTPSRAALRMFPLIAALALALPAATCHPEPDVDLQGLVESMLPRLEARSGLAARGPVRVARRTRDELQSFLVQRLEEDLPPGELEAVETIYRLLGLIPETLDLRSLLLDLYGEQVLGYYDPGTQTLYVMEGLSRDALEPVLVHELVHALQDQHVNLDSLVARERGNDRQLAAQAAIEGHATVVMFEWLMESRARQPVNIAAMPDLRQSLRPILEARDGDFPVFQAAPRLIRETLLFPYLEGAVLVQTLWQVYSGRFAPFGEWLPQSTAQVLDPAARYLPGAEPPPELILAGGSRSGWETAYENELGGLELSILLAEHLGEAARADARGWEADRYRLLRSPGGGHALVWFSVWRDAAAADRFAAAYRRILAARPGRGGRVERVDADGRPGVRVIDADPEIDPAAVPVPELRVRAGVNR